MRPKTGSPLSRQRKGFILVSVLMVSMFLVSSAVGYSWFVRDQVRRFSARKEELEFRGIALMAVRNLIRGLAQDKNSYDSSQEKWFGKHVIPMADRYILSITLEPLNDKLPLAHVFLPDGETVRGEIVSPWKRAWEALGLSDMDTAALDFMDKDETPRVGGAERSFFINRPPSDPGAFLLFKEITVKKLLGDGRTPGLKDLFTYWCGDKINVNTAREPVLQLLDGVDPVTAKEIVLKRKEQPYKSLSDLAKLPAFSGTLGPKLSNLLGTKSDYFSLDLQISDLNTGEGKSYRVIVDKKHILSWEEL